MPEHLIPGSELTCAAPCTGGHIDIRRYLCPQKKAQRFHECHRLSRPRSKPCSAIRHLLRGEDDALYYTLMDHFTKLVGPTDMIEWCWVKDMTDHTWEIRRLRRFKVLFVELQRDHTQRDRDMRHLIEEQDFSIVPDSEKDWADVFMGLIDRYKGVDTLIASAESRRDRTLRAIERHRENLARYLRNASSEMVNGVALPQAAE
jgi:hypothetical protein